ncbi:haloacid dehalogenase-like hydrolase [bacterium]|nr:haloacid dehalogenase-like hydrolase [bacterium]
MTPDFGDGWSPRAVDLLSALVRERGRGSASFDAAHPPVAVFDFDDTMIAGDIGEQVLRAQIDRLIFGMTPDAWRAHMPVDPMGVTHIDPAWGGARIADLSADVADAYAWLFERAQTLGGDTTVDKLRDAPAFAEFRVKMNILFMGLVETHGVGKLFAYPWSNQLDAGLAPGDLSSLALDVYARETAAPRRVETLACAGEGTRAGAQTVRIATGIRETPAMKQAARALSGVGFSVHIVTASMQEIVAPIVSDPRWGYGIPAENVLGMRLVVRGGRYTDELLREGYDVTYGPGKVRVIDQVIGRAPLLVAGDSDTDYEMLNDYSETRVRLVVHRGKGGVMADLYARGERGDAGWCVQYRDEETGELLPAAPCTR